MKSSKPMKFQTRRTRNPHAPSPKELTRWEEDGGSFVYECFTADQSYDPNIDDFSEDDPAQAGGDSSV